MHDFALTAKWCVYLVGPADISLLPFLTGMKSVNDSIKWHPERGTQVVMVSRDGSQSLTFDVDPWFQFHIGGAFDQDGAVIVDLVRFDRWDSVAAPLKDFRNPSGGQEGNLWRYRINPKRQSVVGEAISDLGVEFPQTCAPEKLMPLTSPMATGPANRRFVHASKERSMRVGSPAGFGTQIAARQTLSFLR